MPPTPLHHIPLLHPFFISQKPSITQQPAPRSAAPRGCIWPPSASEPPTPPPTPNRPIANHTIKKNSSGLSSYSERETRAPPGSASPVGKDSVTQSRSDAARAVTPYLFLQQDRSHRVASSQHGHAAA